MKLLTFDQVMRRSPRWISVKDALPSDNITFVFFIGGNYTLTSGIFWRKHGEEPRFYVRAGESLFPCEWAEYWMPAPNDPRYADKANPTT
jgi:hypothetical protein